MLTPTRCVDGWVAIVDESGFRAVFSAEFSRKLIADRYRGSTQKYLATLHGSNAGQRNNKAVVYPVELIYRQLLFNRLQVHAGEYGSRLRTQKNLHIVFQAFDILDIREIDFDLFVFRPHKEKG